MHYVIIIIIINPVSGFEFTDESSVHSERASADWQCASVTRQFNVIFSLVSRV